MRAFLVLVVISMLGACQSGASVGTSCTRDSECASPLSCRLGRCRSACTEQRDCPAGQLCLVSAGVGSCALADDPDCRAGGCGAGLHCVGTACVNLCASVLECPPGSSCVPTDDHRARCARSDLDGGATDASASDAGTSLGDVGSDASDAGSATCAIDAAPFDAAIELDAGSCRPPSCDVVEELSAGDGFTCARTHAGRVYCFGADDEIAGGASPPDCDAIGRCPRPREVQIETASGSIVPATNVRSIVSDSYTSCFVVSGAGPYCFTNNAFGDPISRDPGVYDRYAHALDTPHTFAADWAGHVRDVALGSTSAIAITDCAPWYAWGSDAHGEYGRAGSEDVMAIASEIAPIVDGASVVRLGRDHGCAIVNQQVWCWGNDNRAQVSGVPSSTGGSTALTPAVQVPNVSGAIDLEIGVEYSCALLMSGDVSCWGEVGTIGVSPPPSTCIGPSASVSCPPTLVFRPAGVTYMRLAVAGYTDAACAIDTSHQLWCWGSDYAASRDRPVSISGLGAVDGAVVSWSHMCAIVSGGVWCWGENDWGQLGRDTAGMTDATPTSVVW